MSNLLEERAHNVLKHLPKTPVRIIETTGEFWKDVVLLRTELKIQAAIREVENERTR